MRRFQRRPAFDLPPIKFVLFAGDFTVHGVLDAQAEGVDQEAGQRDLAVREQTGQHDVPDALLEQADGYEAVANGKLCGDGR